MARAGTITLSIDDIQLGVTCSHPVNDESGVLLLGAASTITEQLIEGLRQRGITTLEIDPRDELLLRSKDQRRVVKKTASTRKSTNPSGWRTAEPLKSILVDRHDEAIDPERTERLSQALSQARDALSAFNVGNLKLDAGMVDSCNDISDEYARALIDDCDQTVGSVTTPSPRGDLANRSIQLSVIAMAVGVQMGLDGPQTIELGTAGLLHDVGLLSMDPRFIDPTEPMTEADLWEYQKHPLIATRCLNKATELSAAVESAIEQVHEQYDGSGYPRGLSSRRIHLHARILNVVDTYLQLTRPMIGRAAIVAHDALGLILHQATQGMYDPKVVRAFLTAKTLFPLGSCVELDSGDIATVIRRPRAGYAFPVLLGSDGERIELETSPFEVVRPVVNPEQHQMRLTLTMMQTGCNHDGTRLLAI